MQVGPLIYFTGGQSVNLHSPGPIGDVTPSTIAGTTITTPIVRSPNGSTLTIGEDGAPTGFVFSSSLIFCHRNFEAGTGTEDIGALVPFRNAFLSGTLTLGGDAKLLRGAANALALRNSTNGQTWIVSRTFTDASNKSEFQTVCTGSAVAFTVVEAGSGVGTLLSYTFDKPVNAGANSVRGLLTTNANAVTGLVAGALAALTTATVVIYDGTGTAYRVPCITP